MTPQELKNSILQLAIQGKLVEQRPEEGTAEELYQQIQAEKQALIKAGKLKKEKPLPEITEEEKSFDIPESWKWVRLGSIGDWAAGSTPPRTNLAFYGGNIPWLKTGDLNDSIIDQVPETITELALEKTSVRLNPVGSVLMAMYGATIGKLGIISVPMTTNQACCACIPHRGIYNLYLFYFLLAQRRTFIKKGEGGAQPNISKEKIIDSVFTLPPVGEQRRIVAKIEELLPLIDRYEQAWNRLEDLNKRFPTDLQKSILQLAIQGKLVPQRPEEGTGEELYKQIQAEKQALIKAGKLKKEKPLPEITEAEKPFEIPESWKWVRLASICNGILAGGDKPQDFVKSKDEDHPIPVVANGVTNEGIMGYTAVATAPSNTLTVAGRGTIGFPCYRSYDYCPVVRLIVVIQSNGIDPKYLYYVFRGLPADSVGSSIPQLTVPMVNPKLIPLPPLAEQRRIVARLDELLPSCNKLK